MDFYQAIWPVFGASNQLVAALALLVATTYLLTKEKKIRYTLYPAIFMLVTTIAALVYQTVKFISTDRYLLAIIGIVLIVLAGFMVSEVVKTFRRMKT